MEVINTISKTNSLIREQKNLGKSIGFVPTMGALHEGHLSLIRYSKAENDITVCSIFVNPIQFNNKQDLVKYPRTMETDLKLLKEEGCDIVFTPSAEEMYPETINKTYDFGLIDKVMEGAFRPGHFNGVAIVVKKLFDISIPDKAYFGEKDFQQLCVIEELVRQENMNIEIVPCPILRESDGLAMSSRNTRLTPEQRKTAPIIYKTLKAIKNKKDTMSVTEIKEWVKEEINSQAEMELEYIDIVNSKTLQAVEKISDQMNSRICIAAFLGNVRLIDNIGI
ncbi:pantoate--beta-alanine ligase [Bacteroidota bacterium]